jgi:hypothetical protein
MERTARGTERRDPLAPIMALGRRQHAIGIAVGLVGAFFVHGAGAATSLSKLYELESFAGQVRAAVVEQLRAEYEVSVVDEPPPPPAPVEPAPVAEEPTSPSAPEAPAPEEAPAPAAAQAGAALVAEPSPDEPVDLTGESFTIVSGQGDKFAGGVTEAAGTSKDAVYDQRARVGGVPGGTGTAPAAKGPVAGPDKSRPARPLGGSWNDCGFPAEADMEQVDAGVVSLIVTVGTDGRAKSAIIQSDPGYGFGAHARQCAFRKTYEVALDRAGNPVVSTTAPFRVRFTR